MLNTKSLLLAALCASSLYASAIAVPAAAQDKDAPKPVAAKKGPAGVAAEVNGERVPMGDVDRQVARFKAQEKGLQTNTPETQKALMEIRSSILDGMIDWRLEVQEAKKLKIAPTPAAIDKGVAEFKKAFPSEAELKAALAKENKDLKDVRELITEGLLIEELERRWTAGLLVKEDDIAKFYRDNIAQFQVPEGVRARHILVAFGTQTPSADDKAKAKAKADDLAKKARAKDADFATLAQQNSDDAGSKDRGGDLGAFPRGLMIEPFEKAAFGADKGEIVGPIETQFGYHVIKVEDKIASRTAPLEQAREDIREHLTKLKRSQALQTNLKGLRDKAKIKRYL
jgi:peptidyl-prolyl cis-trans isomerase C